MLYLLKSNQKGFLTQFLLFSIFGLLLFLTLLNKGFFNNFYQIPESKAATVPQSGSKVIYQGKSWNLTGVNMPWYNWACDFGCNNNGGVVQNKTIIGSRLATVKNAGLHTVRWWVFPGDNPWQITVDGSGKPTGINPAVYADFDAALELAETYDLYYNFVLFNSATAPRRSWIDDATHRAALAQVLGTLFARYKDNPRVMTWEIYNEPEFQIWNNEISEANVVATAKAITDSVHANSNALVTVGNAFADGMPMWSSVNLDYYSPHWYDYMNGGGYCLRCNDYNYYKNSMGITKPIVIGEYYGGTNTADDLQRLNDFYNKGYAGAWGWSLFSERTNDLLTFNLSAAQTFTSTHADIGPVAGSVLPSLAATPTPASSPLKIGDIVVNGKVDIFDYNQLLTDFGKTGTNLIADIYKSGSSLNKVDIFDYNLLLTNFGK